MSSHFEERFVSTPKSHTEHRSNKTGQFVDTNYGKRHPDTTTRERVPNPGHGDTGRYDSNKKPPSK